MAHPSSSRSCRPLPAFPARGARVGAPVTALPGAGTALAARAQHARSHPTRAGLLTSVFFCSAAFALRCAAPDAERAPPNRAAGAYVCATPLTQTCGRWAAGAPHAGAPHAGASAPPHTAGASKRRVPADALATARTRCCSAAILSAAMPSSSSSRTAWSGGAGREAAAGTGSWGRVRLRARAAAARSRPAWHRRESVGHGRPRDPGQGWPGSRER